MRPRKADGTFRQEFDGSRHPRPGFIEGNAWNYSLYVPHDRMHLSGFTAEKRDSRSTRYVQCISPTASLQRRRISPAKGSLAITYTVMATPHHVPYLYTITQGRRERPSTGWGIMDTKYLPAPDGLSGNDDCGQMSAWYIFSALGFYPVAPGADRYDLGSPLVREATIELENGKTFTVSAANQGPQNVYVKDGTQRQKA